MSYIKLYMIINLAPFVILIIQWSMAGHVVRKKRLKKCLIYQPIEIFSQTLFVRYEWDFWRKLSFNHVRLSKQKVEKYAINQSIKIWYYRKSWINNPDLSNNLLLSQTLLQNTKWIRLPMKIVFESCEFVLEFLSS